MMRSMVFMLCAAFVSSYAQPAAKPGPWKALFDGTSMDAWRGYKTDVMPEGWKIVNGTLAKTTPVKDIVSKEQFGDFELELEWKIGEAGNSGIFYRGTEEHDRIYWSAPEYQLLDNLKASDNKRPDHLAGAAYELSLPPADAVKPVGEWNLTRIIAKGSHVQHWLNGRKTAEYEVGSPEWDAKVAASKFKVWPNYGRAKKGHIALQGDHSGELAFRNIRIRELQSGTAQPTTTTPQAPPPAPTGYQDTPMQPNGKWHVHDGTRPQPRVVTPGPLVSTPPPSDAIVLLGSGQDMGRWQMTQGGGAVTWPVDNGVLSSGKGMIRTKQDDFTDYQLHVEFATPSEVKGNSQGRGNSGVFLNGVFEIQVLDSYNNITYPDGQASAMYGQYPPMVNASRPPGEWQSYDISFSAPRFNGTTLEKPAIVTVLHNGVTVHAAQAFLGPTSHRQIPPYAPTNAKGFVGLQDHGNPVRFRNIWIRALKPAE